MPKILSSKKPETEFRQRPVKGVSFFVSEDVIDAMLTHADSGFLENKEVMGLLLGHVLKDGDGVYVRAEGTATSDLDADEASVKFREEGLEGLFESIDKCKGDAVVGWYHTHLGIGCYLSEVDIKTHKGIFGEDVGFAVVIDPSDCTLAVFTYGEDGTKKAQMVVFT